MDTNLQIGDVVRSLLGHDQNRLFIVVGIDKNGYLAIIDGKYRKKDCPKLKNPKHLEKVCHDEEILSKFNSPIATNAEIYKMIKKHNQIKE